MAVSSSRHRRKEIDKELEFCRAVRMSRSEDERRQTGGVVDQCRTPYLGARRRCQLYASVTHSWTAADPLLARMRNQAILPSSGEPWTLLKDQMRLLAVAVIDILTQG